MKKNLRNFILLLTASLIAITIPLFLTSPVNRLAANLTEQWYLSNGTRIVITFIMTAVTFALSYLPLVKSDLGSKLFFKVICAILIFLWCVFIGLVSMPD